MRTLRVSMAGTIVLGLLASLPAAVAAQDEADPMGPAYFTFATELSGAFAEGQVTAIDSTTTEMRGGTWVSSAQ